MMITKYMLLVRTMLLLLLLKIVMARMAMIMRKMAV